MPTKFSRYSPKLNYSINFNSDSFNMLESINKETISRYLYDGSYARPGTNHFLRDYSYPKVKKFSINRGKITSISDIENRIRANIKNILAKNKNISLLLTSGFDSYLLYLLLKLETKNFSTHHDISFITGRFDNPYDEFSILNKKRPNIVLDNLCSSISGPDEALKLLKSAVLACNQPVNGLVASAVYKAIKIANKKQSVPLLGTGETIFFTSTYDFIQKVNSSLTRNYSADKTIQLPGNYLTEKGMNYAKYGISDNKNNEHIVFEHQNKLEEFIHNQQFWIDAPRVDFEVSSYCNIFGISAYTPLRDPKLLELFLNLPKEEQHDGRPKTVIRNLISLIEGRDDYTDGLKMTSPQREYLRFKYKDGGFAELVEYFIENSLLAELGIIDQIKIEHNYYEYVKNFDECFNQENFKTLSSYNIWKFFITEFWLNLKIGNNIDIKRFT